MPKGSSIYQLTAGGLSKMSADLGEGGGVRKLPNIASAGIWMTPNCLPAVLVRLCMDIFKIKNTSTTPSRYVILQVFVTLKSSEVIDTNIFISQINSCTP